MGWKNAWEKWKQHGRALKHEVTALFLAYTKHDIPFWAKAVAIMTVGYAMSPIDLIPDFIPVLGHLDDLILLPLGIALAVKLIPPEIMSQCRQEAEDLFKDTPPMSRTAAAVIIFIWVGLGWLLIAKLMSTYGIQ